MDRRGQESLALNAAAGCRELKARSLWQQEKQANNNKSTLSFLGFSFWVVRGVNDPCGEVMVM